MQINQFFLLNPSDTKDLRKRLRNNPTIEEVLLWTEIKNRKLDGIKFRRQYGIGPYVVDFYSTELKLIIEVDGSIHELTEHKLKDIDRENFLNSNGFQIIRFKNSDINYRMNYVLESIKNEILKIKTK
jgi:very-short-patch-repair endonuclease